jgi:hypothetical protein
MMDERLAVPAGQEHVLPPARAPEPGGGTDGGPLGDPRILQILSTEHWSLLSARSLVYNEAFARAGMFLTFVSATLVALALAGPAMTFSSDFLLLATGLLALDLLMGFATVARLLDATLDDLRAIHGMNRIRNGYAQIAPDVLPFLITSIHDDAAGVMATYGVQAGSQTFLGGLIHGLSTTNGMISTINAALAGAVAGLATVQMGGSASLAAAATIVVFFVLFTAESRYAFRVIRRFEGGVESRFPTPR